MLIEIFNGVAVGAKIVLLLYLRLGNITITLIDLIMFDPKINLIAKVHDWIWNQYEHMSVLLC